jgi:hypothetical protein
MLLFDIDGSHVLLLTRAMRCEAAFFRSDLPTFMIGILVAA